MRRFLAVDTEDDSRGELGIVNFFDGQRHTTFTREPGESSEGLRVRAWRWLAAQAPPKRSREPALVVWACNAEYDLVNLFGPYVGRVTTIMYVSAGLLRAHARGRKLVVLDTTRHWPMGVKQMGEYLGLPKLEADFASVEYCRRDTEIVWRFVAAMLEGYDTLGLELRATLPAMALQFFERYFYCREFPRLPSALTEWFRRGYYGGRVEVYRLGVIQGRTYHYDVNSLFPSVMLRDRYPVLETLMDRGTRLDLDREGMAHVVIDVPECAYPPLPVVGHGELLFPWGRLEGVWPYPELRRAVRQGAQIVRVLRAVEGEGMPSPFAEYVRHCYAVRSRTRPGSLENVLWKLLMNSLYGKFGQSSGLEMIYEDRLLEVNGDKPARHANVIWAAYVTSWARLKLLDYLERCSTCYYTDTDSLLTPDQLAVSSRLGALKLERICRRVEILGPKVYLEEDTTGRVHRRAKGVPPEAAEDFIRLGRAVFRKPVRLRESRRLGLVPNVWVDFERRRLAEYRKRRVLPDGGTEPWRWDRYLAEHGG